LGKKKLAGHGQLIQETDADDGALYEYVNADQSQAC
jgi:hypothetical protein